MPHRSRGLVLAPSTVNGPPRPSSASRAPQVRAGQPSMPWSVVRDHRPSDQGRWWRRGWAVGCSRLTNAPVGQAHRWLNGRVGALPTLEGEGNRLPLLDKQAWYRPGRFFLKRFNQVVRPGVFQLAIHLAEVTTHTYLFLNVDSLHLACPLIWYTATYYRTPYINILRITCQYPLLSVMYNPQFETLHRVPCAQ